MARKNQSFERNRKKKLERRKKREREKRSLAPPARLSRRLAVQLEEAYALIEEGECELAEGILVDLDERSNGDSGVLEGLMCLYQQMGDHEQCREVARRLVKLDPHDWQACLIYAQESAFCGRVVTAIKHYRIFLKRWPDHEQVPKIEHLLEDGLMPLTEEIAATGLSWEDDLDLLILHEESLDCLQAAQFDQCAKNCRTLIAKAPQFVSARNNLCVACFQMGRIQEALAVAEETCQLYPDNDFAAAILAKLYFLSGRESEANELADQLMADPPTKQDSVVATLEMLTYLARDEDILALVDRLPQNDFDPVCQAMIRHASAFAKYRLGDVSSARKLWRDALKYSQLPEAGENLQDVVDGKGHAAWGASCVKWIPQPLSREILETTIPLLENPGDKTGGMVTRWPALTTLVPALLDRGDEAGRRVAIVVAKADGSPAMLEALKMFALGSRGPDSMRTEVLFFLHGEGMLDSDQQTFFSEGKPTQVNLFSPEIFYEPVDMGLSDEVIELLALGNRAMYDENYDLAESRFTEALEKAESGNTCSLVYNLCNVWLVRDGKKGKKKAIATLEQLHQEYPEYSFASIALAMFAAQEGDREKASQLIGSVLQKSRLHVSEALALFAAQIEIALEYGEIEGAEQAFEMFCSIAEDDDPRVKQLKAKIRSQRRPKGLRNLLKASRSRLDRQG